MEEAGLDQTHGDEAFDRALQALDDPLGQGSAAGAIALGVEHAHDILPAGDPGAFAGRLEANVRPID
jgi:hypothetical protein